MGLVTFNGTFSFLNGFNGIQFMVTFVRFSRHLNPQLLLFLQQLQRHSPGRNAARHRRIDDSGEGHVVQWQPAVGEGIILDDFWGYPLDLGKLQMEKHGFYMDWT